ncbi:multidrug resistance-associated abc transporter [Diaporthe eres]|nr:multidrug resistance-associated abc transporter [Diaporthe eres]
MQAWWLVPSHLAMAAIVTTVLFQIDGWVFLDTNSFGDNTHGLSTLDPSDIITIVSTLLVITRIFASAWQALCAWRCVFVLLEKAGIRLEDMNWILSRGLLIPPLRRCSPWHIFSALALLMAWPAQFSSPIAQGSINWFTDYGHQWSDVPGSVPSVTNMQSPLWDEFDKYPELRAIVVKSAAGRAAMAFGWNDVLAQRRPTAAQLISPAFGRMQMLGSWIRNVTAPVIYLDNGSWVEEDLPTDLNASLLDGDSGYLSVSGNSSPLIVDGLLGNAAILKDWKQVSVSTDRDLWTGEQFAALLVGSCRGANTSDCTMPLASPTGRIFRKSLSNNITNCYQVLKLNVTAGVTNCETSKSLHCEVVDLSIATLSSTSEQKVLVNTDVMLPLVFNMMPEVMQTLVAIAGLRSVDNQAQK